MSQSGATVKVYIGSRLMATYNVPRNRMGTLWHVFDYNPVTNALIEKGQVYNHADPANVGLTSVALDESEEPVVDTSLDDLSEDERENIMMIFNDLEEK
jgi:hypothetical protein